MSLRDLQVPVGGAPLLGAGGRDDADAHAPGTGSISAWDISTGVDGPGTRFVLFTSGCPLRCLYCHNPETWHMRDGHVVQARNVLDELDRYTGFMHASGGGITITGGEPLLQPRFVGEVLAGATARGLHTALDTAGSVRVTPAIDQLLDSVDLVLLDIKAADPQRYEALTGGSLERTLEFARHLAARDIETWVRYVLVPDLTDDIDEIRGVARICSKLGIVTRVDVLPYHRLGVHKYETLGIEYPLGDTPPPTPEALARAVDAFRAEGLHAV